jgi:hypothetical protein
MAKYLLTAFAVFLVAWWAVMIYLRVGMRTLLTFMALLASVAGFIFAITSLRPKTVKAVLMSQAVGFGVILAVVALFVYFWRKDIEEGAGRINRREGR